MASLGQELLSLRFKAQYEKCLQVQGPYTGGPGKGSFLEPGLCIPFPETSSATPFSKLRHPALSSDVQARFPALECVHLLQVSESSAQEEKDILSMESGSVY